MENMNYFMKQHPPVYDRTINDSELYIGVSDRPWIYINTSNEDTLHKLLDSMPNTYNNYAVIEDWMLPIIDPNNIRYRELICERFYLPESVVMPEVKSQIFPLEIEDATIIQSSHAYGEFTDLDYVTSRIKNGHHAGIKVNGDLVAWAITHDDGAIGFLYVKPEYRGSGFGKDISTFIINILRSENLPVYVHIEKDNTASIKLVTKMGFVHDRTVRWFTVPPSLNSIFSNLFETYGPQNWWPAETAFEMMVGAILTQNTSWFNVEKSLKNFPPLIGAKEILEQSDEALCDMIRPSGFYNQKSKRLKEISRWFVKHHCDVDYIKTLNEENLRAELLAIKGIGKETADSILLYAFEKPYFIVDAYTRRLLNRLGYELPLSYESFRQTIERQFIVNDHEKVQLYGEFHALIVMHAKECCKKAPLCRGCCFKPICKTVN